jgi:hypothetical protein
MLVWDDVLGSDNEEGIVAAPVHRIRGSSNTSYPGVADGDPILWSRWDELRGDGAITRRLLLDRLADLGQYELQTGLRDIEPVELRLETRTFAGVIPAPSLSKVEPFLSQRSLISVA